MTFLHCSLLKHPDSYHRRVYILSFTAALIFVSLYSCSTDLRPRPPRCLGRYITAVELSGCFPPFSWIIFLVSPSTALSSVIGHCWVHIKMMNTGSANWLVAITRLKSERGLDQITDRCFTYSGEFVAWTFFDTLNHWRLIEFKACCIIH